MKVFVTGATGYVGSAVVRELADAGHRVTGLVRTPGKTDYLADELGGRPAYGDIAVPASYRSLAGEYDALVHLAYDRDDPVSADRTAVDALLHAAREGDRPRVLVYTSGSWVLGETGPDPADESAPTDAPADVVRWRPRHEELVLRGDGEELATAVIRPGMVYGGSGGLTARWYESAVRDGAAEYVGDGDQHWSLVYRGDLARLYRTVLEQAAGGVFHGVDGTPLPARGAVRAASEAAGAGGRVTGIPLEEARGKLGSVADALCLDQRLEAVRSRALGWKPRFASYLDGADEAFREWDAARARAGGGPPVG